MTSIRSFAEILRDSPDIDRDQSERFLSIIHDESIRLTRLLDQILEMSRLESGQMNLQMIDADVEDALDRAIASCRGLAETTNVGIVTQHRVNAMRMQADPDRLTQVFINLITNAIRYNTNESPQVDISSRVTSQGYVVEVSDNGSGISAVDREKIFTKFARGDSPTRDGQLGMGLGLTISREIVHVHGGALTLLDQEATRGTCFRVTLPISLSA